MRRFNMAKGVSTALVAVALATGLTSVPANAANVAPLAQTEVTQYGGPTVGAPVLNLKETVGTGQVISGWTFNYSAVPAPVEVTENGVKSTRSYTLYVAIFEAGDRTKPLNGSFTKDNVGKDVLSTNLQFDYVDPAKKPTNEFTINSSRLTPGKKEVVAYLFDANAYQNDYNAAEAQYKANGYKGEKQKVSKADYFVASAPVAIDIDMETYVKTTVTSTSVQLDMSGANGATGFEVYRKIGSKYQKVGTVASYVYTDKGLESKKTYSYKVRPYYVDKSGATTYGKYTTVDATTIGSALNLKAKVNSKGKVELSWKKVVGATKYEIYRVDTDSSTSTIANGEYNGYSSKKLIATVKKTKKKYTDKKVSSNRDYTYVVRAVLSKNENVKNDKKRVVEEGTGVSLTFSKPSVISKVTDANGNVTVEWDKVNGAAGYLVEQQQYDAASETTSWVPYATLGKGTTKVKLASGVTYDKDGNFKDKALTYRIRAFKGNTYSDAATVSASFSLGNVQKVNAEKTDNGIKVSWTPVANASYYKVYRVCTDAMVNNKDKGAYAVQGTLVKEYVGAGAPVAVDVTAWNAAVDASIAKYNADHKAWVDGGYKGDFDSSKYLYERNKLNANTSYHYQNYSYARSVFDANTTSIVDYFGDIYEGSGSVEPAKKEKTADGKTHVTEWKYTYSPVVEDTNVKNTVQQGRPQEGVSYTYYVVAYAGTAKNVKEYAGENPVYTDDYYTTKYSTGVAYNTAVTGAQTETAYATPIQVVNTDTFKNIFNTSGVTTPGKATFTSVTAAAKPAISSVKIVKNKATIKIKKKVKNAAYYKVYRSTKKNGKFVAVGETKNASTLKVVDSSVESGKTYYYKVVSVVKNEAGAEVESAASTAKKVKAGGSSSKTTAKSSSKTTTAKKTTAKKTTTKKTTTKKTTTKKTTTKKTTSKKSTKKK